MRAPVVGLSSATEALQGKDRGVGMSESLPRESFTDETRFTLRCYPDDAIQRIRAAEELGFDDVLFSMTSC